MYLIQIRVVADTEDFSLTSQETATTRYAIIMETKLKAESFSY